MSGTPLSPLPMIECRNLVKEFPIHLGGAKSIKEMALKGFFHQGEKSQFRALNNVSFDLNRGESIALIGRNGSGKSTLLRVISGVSPITSGVAQVNGRVVALLELGAAFHPELTGMENIFLQNSVLGFTHEQTCGMLDEILNFSELHEFIHMPIKRYSSGMRMRLAFALAMQQEGDILIIDEVLAVGDHSFRSRCLLKLMQLKEEGRSILFVSHQMDQVGLIADRVLWLESGSIRELGSVGEVVPNYLQSYFEETSSPVQQTGTGLDGSTIDLEEKRRTYVMATSVVGVRSAFTDARILNVQFLNQTGTPTLNFETGGMLRVQVDVEILRPIRDLEVLMGFSGFEDLPVAILGTEQQGTTIINPEGLLRVSGTLENFAPSTGRFKVSIALSDPRQPNSFFDSHLEVYSFHVHSYDHRRRDVDNWGIMLPPGRFVY
jgi:ABC-type polysaccharide/polyol phosphate transport system ATPase subunit